METKANDRDLIGSYRTADPQGRLEIVFANYHIFPKVIRKMEKKTQYYFRLFEKIQVLIRGNAGSSTVKAKKYQNGTFSVRKKYLYSIFFSKISVLYLQWTKRTGKQNTRAAESIFFCKRIPAMMSVRS